MRSPGRHREASAKVISLSPLRGCTQLGPRLDASAVKLEQTAHDSDHLRAHVHDVLGPIAARQRDYGPVLEASVGAAYAQGSVHHDPACTELEVHVGELERPVDADPREGRGAHVEVHRSPVRDRYDFSRLGKLPAPGRRVRPRPGSHLRSRTACASSSRRRDEKSRHETGDNAQHKAALQGHRASAFLKRAVRRVIPTRWLSAGQGVY